MLELPPRQQNLALSSFAFMLSETKSAKSFVSPHYCLITLVRLRGQRR